MSNGGCLAIESTLADNRDAANRDTLAPSHPGSSARHDLVISFVIQQTDDTPSMAHDRVLRRDSKSKAT